jgi:hypothetical protein
MTRYACLVAVLALSACGGSDGPATAPQTESGPPSTRAAYIARADAFCADAASDPELSQSLEQLENTPESDPNFRALAEDHFRLVLEIAERARTGFMEIEPPEADQPAITELNAANNRAIERLRDLISALEGSDDPSPELDSYAEAIDAAARLADAYGFEVCAGAGGS